jgi:hypothetical protein
MKMLDRKRAPALRERPAAQLPALVDRQAILSRARALLARQHDTAPPQPAMPQSGVSAALVKADGSRSPKAAVRNLPAVVKGRSVPARRSQRSAPASVARRPAGQGQPVTATSVPATQRMEVPPGQGTTAVQNSGSGQTIIVQVSAPQPSYPWWGPWWWGYAPVGCEAHSCPMRLGQPCKRWFCGW